MQANWQHSLKWVLAHEGGYVNHPKDPGGATNQGITHRVYDAWRRRNRLSPRHVRDITTDEVKAIYREQYWDKVLGDDLPSGLDYAVFDFAVNSGVSRAVKFLQRVLGVDADGIIGHVTLEAVEHADVEAVIKALCERRWAWLKTLRHWGTFGRGWTRRVMGEQIGIQARDTGVIDRAAKLAQGAAHIPAPSIRDDGAGARAESDERNVGAAITAVVTDAKKWAQGGGAALGVGAITQIEGPVAYSVAAAIVIFAMVAALYVISEMRGREA